MGLGGSWAQLIKSQRRCSSGEVTILKQPPTLDTLGFQALKILTQELHSVVVLSQTFIPIPLTPQPISHACGVDTVLHPELAELRGQLSPSVGCLCI